MTDEMNGSGEGENQPAGEEVKLRTLVTGGIDVNGNFTFTFESADQGLMRVQDLVTIAELLKREVDWLWNRVKIQQQQRQVRPVAAGAIEPLGPLGRRGRG